MDSIRQLYTLYTREWSLACPNMIRIQQICALYTLWDALCILVHLCAMHVTANLERQARCVHHSMPWHCQRHLRWKTFPSATHRRRECWYAIWTRKCDHAHAPFVEEAPADQLPIDIALVVYSMDSKRANGDPGWVSGNPVIVYDTPGYYIHQWKEWENYQHASKMCIRVSSTYLHASRTSESCDSAAQTRRSSSPCLHSCQL